VPNPDIYRRISERFLQVANITCIPVWEGSGFASYHAFESIGAAWIRHRGRNVPMSHRAKLNAFRTLAPAAHRHSIAGVAIAVNALRNRMLYPVQVGGGAYDRPENQFTPAQAQQLRQRVDGIYNVILPLL
jgi:hypothetical protein